MSSWDQTDKRDVNLLPTVVYRCIAAAVTLVIAGGTSLNAQQPLTPYVNVGGGLSLEQGAYIEGSGGGSKGLGGGTLSGGVGIGLRIARRARIGAEASFGRPKTRLQNLRFGTRTVIDYERTHDSRIVSGVVGIPVTDWIWVVGGMGLLRSTTFEVSTTISNTFAPESPPIVASRAYQWTSAAGVLGVDSRWVERDHLAVVPSIRAYVSKRDRGEFSRLGLGPLVLRPSIGIEIGF
jgi:hypothetical protein